MDVSRVKGPESSPERDGKRSIGDDQRFREEMRVQKIKEIDPDQKKKKRERAQSSEEPQQTRRQVRSNRTSFSIFDKEFSAPREKDIYGRTQTTKGKGSYGRPQPSQVPSSPPSDASPNRLPTSYTFWEDNASDLEETAERPQPRSAPRQPQKRQEPAPKKHKKMGADHKTEKKEKGAKKRVSHKPVTSSLPETPKMKTADKKPDFVFDEDEEEEESSAAKSMPSARSLSKKVKKETDLMPSAPAKPKKSAKGLKEETSLPVRPHKAKQDEIPIPPKKEEGKKKEVTSPILPKRAKKGGKEQIKGTKHKGLKELANTFSPVLPLDEQTEKKGGEKRQQKKEIEAPQPLPISPQAIGPAISATTQVMAHIPSEVHNLFTQMVGTIIVMSQQDITRTEVILNSPAFQNSQFFGARILVERYAIAPDSFNIRLMGTTQQVNQFNANLEGLWNAFEKGKFSFRIGRLEASYEPTRALFRRKEKTGKKDSDLGDNPKE